MTDYRKEDYSFRIIQAALFIPLISIQSLMLIDCHHPIFGWSWLVVGNLMMVAVILNSALNLWVER